MLHVSYCFSFDIAVILTFYLVQNVPNEVPLCTLLAMYNESLIAMCSGYHPNHYWETHNSDHNEINIPQTIDET